MKKSLNVQKEPPIRRRSKETTKARCSTVVDQRYFVYGNYIDEPLLMVNVAANPADLSGYRDRIYCPVIFADSR
jgi:hypothetical protein